MTYWKLVGLTDVRARLLADRHYSRQNPGTPCFTPPGNNIILLGLNDDALWVSHRPDPKAGKEVAYRRDGFDYWDNPYFRNESGLLASDLILDALAITLHIWGADTLPPDGFHTFVNPEKVKPTKVHGELVYGFCFGEAQFDLHPDRTKERNLLRYIFPSRRLRWLEPLQPNREQLRMFA